MWSLSSNVSSTSTRKTIDNRSLIHFVTPTLPKGNTPSPDKLMFFQQVDRVKFRGPLGDLNRAVKRCI
jgi:hypothetical protein